MTEKIKSIVTVPPHAPYIEQIARHPIVGGLRLNTVMPIKGTLEDTLKRLQGHAGEKDLWIDLKARQLRVKTFGVPPFTEIELTHQIEVNTPTIAYFCDGRESAMVLEVDGNRLIMQDGPRRPVGPGESVNIPDSSLHVKGFLTDTDKRYIETGQKVGITHYMLSFVEQQKDIELFKEYAPDAHLAAKIESMRGMYYVHKEWQRDVQLMAARGDLYVEVTKPHYIVRAVEDIVRQDPDAIAASRIFSSLAASLEPSCADIGDVDNLLRMGYKNLMLGDEISLHETSVMSALNLLSAMTERYRR